jgi:RHS repeat-associated protein
LNGFVEWERHRGRRIHRDCYYRARYYEPSLGRFISEDPAGFNDGMHLYAYVRNIPTELVDASGLIHQAWDEPPYDGRLHDDAAGGLEVLCTKGRNKERDIEWLEHSLNVRGAELERLGKDADAGHITRFDLEIEALERCKEECDKDKKPEPINRWLYDLYRDIFRDIVNSSPPALPPTPILPPPGPVPWCWPECVPVFP